MIDTNSLCIFIASHISNEKRIRYLKECLDSLINQTLQIHIYLSISFENIELMKGFKLQIADIVGFPKLIIKIREQKTPQMRHMELLHGEFSNKHQWIMFIDDDDTYEKGRVERFAKVLDYCLNLTIKEGDIVTGLYESTFGKDHREHRHEYWCYCVSSEIMRRFFNSLRPYPDILDNKCCDVLFAEFLRRLNSKHLFARLEEHFYNYRVDDNTDSVTGFIKTNQHKYTATTEPPAIEDENWAEYVVEWNDYLHENIDVYIHDTYLRTLVGCDLEYILKQEFRSNYSLLEFVDASHKDKIENFHNRFRKICNEIYDNPL
jgi:glycosyltransferase involved in cell wall biosynthesis